jgi:hypothetical protein
MWWSGDKIAHRDKGTILNREPTQTRHNQENGTTEVECWTPSTDPGGLPPGPLPEPAQNITTKNPCAER